MAMTLEINLQISSCQRELSMIEQRLRAPTTPQRLVELLDAQMRKQEKITTLLDERMRISQPQASSSERYKVITTTDSASRPNYQLSGSRPILLCHP